MDRRNFLRGLGALVGGIAVAEAIPLSRVWSFPKDIKSLNFEGLLAKPGEPTAQAIWRGTDFENYLAQYWKNYKMVPEFIFINPELPRGLVERKIRELTEANA